MGKTLNAEKTRCLWCVPSITSFFSKTKYYQKMLTNEKLTRCCSFCWLFRFYFFEAAFFKDGLCVVRRFLPTQIQHATYFSSVLKIFPCAENCFFFEASFFYKPICSVAKSMELCEGQLQFARQCRWLRSLEPDQRAHSHTRDTYVPERAFCMYINIYIYIYIYIYISFLARAGGQNKPAYKTEGGPPTLPAELDPKWPQ